MPLHGKRHLFRIHPAAIVGYLDAIDAAAREAYIDTERTGVDRVLDQFFQRTGRSFYHFTGSDPVNQIFGEPSY